ncbi:PseG/SpsG family protein [Tepidibacillus infernus]|uniref:PseG/SpsG family protein n=1 Tax=Tepidibacillus infernus TaxID=1806172 RepID=UPI003B6E14EE
MKVYIFTEGGSKFGYGHVVRCSSLYSELENRGIDVEYIINGNEEVVEVLGDKKHMVRNWLSTDYLSTILNNEVYAIVDSYLANFGIYEYISKHTKKSLFIDDNMRLTYPKGIVVNPSIYAKELKYPQIKGVHYLLGNEYVILRGSFFDSKRETLKTEVKEILVTLGGADIRNITPKILDILNTEYPNVVKNVVIGKGFKNIEEIKRIDDKNISYYYNVNGIEMKALMLRSDMAISAAGQTIYELIKTETPFIPIRIIDNQENNVKGLLKYNLVNRVLDSESSNFTKELSNEIRLLMNLENRTILYNSMKGIIDGLGRTRIIDELLM